MESDNLLKSAEEKSPMQASPEAKRSAQSEAVYTVGTEYASQDYF